MGDDKPFRIQYLSARQPEQARRQAIAIANQVFKYLQAGGHKVEIEVVTPDIQKLKDRISQLENIQKTYIEEILTNE